MRPATINIMAEKSYQHVLLIRLPGRIQLFYIVKLTSSHKCHCKSSIKALVYDPSFIYSRKAEVIVSHVTA